MAKKKKSKEIDLELELEEVSSEVDSEENNNSQEDMGSYTYEELVDKNEELEKSVLRANADLDNALKRTLSEVEKAHKYGIEKLLNELLPVIDNLEHALNNLSENAERIRIVNSNINIKFIWLRQSTSPLWARLLFMQQKVCQH